MTVPHLLACAVEDGWILERDSELSWISLDYDYTVTAVSDVVSFRGEQINTAPATWYTDILLVSDTYTQTHAHTHIHTNKQIPPELVSIHWAGSALCYNLDCRDFDNLTISEGHHTYSLH